MFFLARGLEPQHEGFYFSEAWRFAQGDILFQDSTTSSFTLVFWWESWILRIFPECGFLGLRVIWAITMLLCALVTLGLMLRYFSPLVSFTGAAASLLYVAASSSIKAPSYNSMPALPLLLAIWLWLAAYHRSGKAQLFLSAGAGMSAFLATTCRITLVVIILLPLLTMVYDRCCGIKVDGIRRMAITFFVTYFAGVLCFFLAAGSMGLTGDLFNGWAVETASTGHGLVELTHRMVWSSLFILLPALVVVIIAAFFRYKENLKAFAAQHKKAIIVCILLVALLGSFYLYELHGFHWARLLVGSLINEPIKFKVAWLLFLFAIGVIIADVIFHLFNRVFNLKTGDDAARTHDRRGLGIVAVFLCLVTILGTNELPARPVWLNSWLLISLAVGLSCVWFSDWSKYLTKNRPVWLLRGVCTVFLLPFICYCIGSSLYPWGDRPIWELGASPDTAVFHGILTSPSRADFIDSVVDAVERNSEVGDRILVYYYHPWVYGATSRLPSTYITWFFPQTAHSSKQSALDDMIERGRVPKIVLYNPMTVNELQLQDDPIHQYVKERYEVAEEVYGVKIMLPSATMKNKGH